jgi:hypothetical protein
MPLLIAHHALVLALPFAVPALVIVVGLVAIAAKDRLKGE